VSEPTSDKPVGPGRRRRLAVGAIVSTILIATAYLYWLRENPRVVLLVSESGADWIRPDESMSLEAHNPDVTVAGFRTDVQFPTDASAAVLSVRALGNVAVYLDETLVFNTDLTAPNWRTRYQISLPAEPGGAHRLRLIVANRNGPSLVVASCAELGLRSGEGWEASIDGQRWRQAAVARYMPDPDVALRFPSVGYCILKMLPLLVCMFVVGFVPLLAGGKLITACRLSQASRWGILAAWLVLGINNIFKVPAHVGYDVVDHLRYILYVADTGRIPLPSEGWQFFQSPLYYFISAGLYRLFLLCATANKAAAMLRIVPLICGASLVEISYRTARHAFPGRPDLWAVSTTVGGLLPMNLYMAQVISNEPMAACLSGIVALLTFRFLARPEVARSIIAAAVCGAVLGLSLLTKVTAVIWVVPVCVALTAALVHQHYSMLRIFARVAVLLVAAGSIGGWYYLRNWIVIGTPFSAGWDSARIPWWQDPGFRTPIQFLEFGHIFCRPIYGGVRSIWDSLYSTLWADGFLSGVRLFEFRPPWHFELMACGVWLAILPTAAILAGSARVVGRAMRRTLDPASVGLWFAVMSVGCLLAAVVHLYLTVPIFSCAKASYLSGATPCLAVLSAEGFDILGSHRVLRALAGGVLFCWGVTAFLTYFVT
jgi:hypothetical protein